MNVILSLSLSLVSVSFTHRVTYHMLIYMILFQFHGTLSTSYFGMDIVEMLLQLTARYRFFAVVTQHQMAPTVHFMHGEVGSSNIFFAKTKEIEDNI